MYCPKCGNKLESGNESGSLCTTCGIVYVFDLKERGTMYFLQYSTARRHRNENDRLDTMWDNGPTT